MARWPDTRTGGTHSQQSTSTIQNVSLDREASMTEQYKLEQYGRRLEQLIKENTRISVCSVHCARTHTWPLLYYSLICTIYISSILDL